MRNAWQPVLLTLFIYFLPVYSPIAVLCLQLHYSASAMNRGVEKEEKFSANCRKCYKLRLICVVFIECALSCFNIYIHIDHFFLRTYLIMLRFVGVYCVDLHNIYLLQLLVYTECKYQYSFENILWKLSYKNFNPFES